MIGQDTDEGVWLRRLPAYLYLRDVVVGRRVLEVGCGDGRGAAFLADHGAARVVGIDGDGARIEAARRIRRVINLELRRELLTAVELEDASFDVVVVPSATALVRNEAVLRELRRVLAPGGWLVAIAPSADWPGAPAGALSYHDLVARLDPRFGPVRVIAQMPMVAMALVEYGAAVGDAALDVTLADGGGDAVVDYVALCGGGVEDMVGGAARGFMAVELPLAGGLEAIRSGLGIGPGGGNGVAAGASSSGAPDGAVTATTSEQIAAAMARHAEEVRELDDALAERDEFAAELERDLATLRATHAEVQEKLARVTANWREADGKKDDVWRRVGELQAELEKHREDTITKAAKVRRDHQLELARAVEDVSSKHLVAKTQLARCEQERDAMQAELAASERRTGELGAALETAEAARAELEARVGELEAARDELARQMITKLASGGFDGQDS